LAAAALPLLVAADRLATPKVLAVVEALDFWPPMLQLVHAEEIVVVAVDSDAEGGGGKDRSRPLTGSGERALALAVYTKV
jgi:hypothetical protein